MTFNQLYKLILEEFDEDEEIHLQGEYWFDEDGSTMYADGDIGDMDHEDYVKSIVTSTILNYFGLELKEFDSFDLADHFEQIKEVLAEDIDKDDDEAWEKFENDFWNDPKQMIEDYIVENFNEPREKITKMLWMRDAREYAIEEWSWSRVHGKSIEVKRLDTDQINRVSRGIWNALDEEGLIDSDEERMIAGQSEYFISTYTGKSYTTKLDDMDSPENISGLEETPIQHEPGFANLDRMDQKLMSDYYKGKPIGDSVDWSFLR